MLNKDCRRLLDAMIQDLPNQPYRGYESLEFARVVKMPDIDAERIARYLHSLGYVDIETVHHSILGEIKYFRLTELGRSYRSEIRQKRLDYIKDKWVDVLASVISLIALIVSIIALSH